MVGGLRLFVTGAKEGEGIEFTAGGDGVDKIDVQRRRLGKQDLDLDGRVQKYYLCTGTPLRKQLMEWLPGKELVFEDFNF